MSSENLHEPAEALSERTKNLHRGIVSLIEELEAIDWYQQRAEACTDDALRAVLLHNKNEEIEHAAMTLEWIRRTDPVVDRYLREVLFTDAPIHETGDETGEDGGGVGADASLGIGSLRSPS
jgi:uncharacterized protein